LLVAMYAINHDDDNNDEENPRVSSSFLNQFEAKKWL